MVLPTLGLWALSGGWHSVAATARQSPGLETEIPKSLTNGWSCGEVQRDAGKTNPKLIGKSFLS